MSNKEQAHHVSNSAAGTAPAPTLNSTKSSSVPRVPFSHFLRFLVEVCMLSALSLVVKTLWKVVVSRTGDGQIKDSSKSREDDSCVSSPKPSEKSSEQVIQSKSLVGLISASASCVHGLDTLDLVRSAAMVLVMNSPKPGVCQSPDTLPEASQDSPLSLLASPRNSSEPSSPILASLVPNGSAGVSTASMEECKTRVECTIDDARALSVNEADPPKLSKTARRRRNRRIRMAPYLTQTPKSEPTTPVSIQPALVVS